MEKAVEVTGEAMDTATEALTQAKEVIVRIESLDVATRLTNARLIALTGDATGSTSFDGSQDVAIDVTIPRATERDIQEVINNGAD